MSEPSDAELLAKWLKQQSEEAFRALTARYAGLVLMAARQTCRNEALAADVAQMTFITLARKGAALLGRDTLAGWLHRTAVFHSKNALQSQRNESRKRDEFGSHFRRTAPDAIGATREEIEPLLAEALDALPHKDRDALLLRYYRRLSLKEVAEAQTISAAAAQKRVDRAIERLRRQLALRGCVAGSGLGATLANGLGGASSVPSSIVASLTNESIAAAASVAAPSLLSLLLSFLTMKKALAILSAVLLLTVVGTLAFQTKPDAISSTTVDLPSGSEPGLRPVETGPRPENPAATEQERLKQLYGAELWRISARAAEDVIVCTHVMRLTVEPHLAEMTPMQSFGSLALPAIEEAVIPGQEDAVRQVAQDFVKRQWEESRQSMERLNQSPATLMEVLLASDACARGEISLADYEQLRNGKPELKAVAIPVDLANRSVAFGFGSPLKDEVFLTGISAHLNEPGRAKLEEAARKEIPVGPTSTFDQLPATRLENLAAQAKGARQIIEALSEELEIE